MLRCIKCNYHLKGLSHDAKCPECGIDISETIRSRRKWLVYSSEEVRRRASNRIRYAMRIWMTFGSACIVAIGLRVFDAPGVLPIGVILVAVLASAYLLHDQWTWMWASLLTLTSVTIAASGASLAQGATWWPVLVIYICSHGLVYQWLLLSARLECRARGDVKCCNVEGIVYILAVLAVSVGAAIELGIARCIGVSNVLLLAGYVCVLARAALARWRISQCWDLAEWS